MTTYAQLLDRIVTDGIAEVREAYAEPKNHHKRDGAIEGFEACRDKSPTELVALWLEAIDQCSLARAEKMNNEDYWKCRYKALQVEWVLNVISVGLKKPLLAHLPTHHGAMKYAEIVGVSGSLEGAS